MAGRSFLQVVFADAALQVGALSPIAWYGVRAKNEIAGRSRLLHDIRADGAS